MKTRSSIDDVIRADLDVLFVGINPDPVSGARGNHFANPRNPFWTLLYEAGFTPRRLSPSEEAKLLDVGIGVTNLVPRIAPRSSDLTREDFEQGACELERKIARWRPRAVVFVGLTAWRALLGGRAGGVGAEPARLAGARVFVLPNPSGRNARFSRAELLRRWRVVARELSRGSPHRARILQVGRSVRERASDRRQRMRGTSMSRRQRGARGALSTDLYELSMGASYLALGMNRPAIFSLSVRTLPRRRALLIVAGIDEAVGRLTSFVLAPEDVAYVASTGGAHETRAKGLASTRFTGDVWAVREGRAIFADEPLLEVHAPLIEAQLVESILLNAVHYPTLVATKAARCVAAAPGKALVDFALRRCPSIDAGLVAARASYLAGFAATSNVLAAHEHAIPISGTMAHSFVEVFGCEADAFRAFASTATGPITLLVDTYDTLSGLVHAIGVAKEMLRRGVRIGAIRLDSGDLAALSRRAREMLDEAGLDGIRIFASGGLDEYELARLSRAGAPIDGYGIGTRLGMSDDSPVLDLVYKIVEYDGRACVKLSEGKATLAGPKQIWRRRGPDGRYAGDLISARDEPAPGPGWEPLLELVVHGGCATALPPLEVLRAGQRAEMGALPPHLLDLEPTESYPVGRSPALMDRQRIAVAEVRRREGLGSTETRRADP